MLEDHATHSRSTRTERRFTLTEAGERALAAFDAPVPFRPTSSRSTFDHEQGAPLEHVGACGFVS